MTDDEPTETPRGGGYRDALDGLLFELGDYPELPDEEDSQPEWDDAA